MTSKVPPQKIRAAGAALAAHNPPISPSVISPRDLAQASMQLSKSFGDTLALISKLMMGGQAQGDFPQTTAALAAAAGKS